MDIWTLGERDLTVIKLDTPVSIDGSSFPKLESIGEPKRLCIYSMYSSSTWNASSTVYSSSVKSSLFNCK
jgi:hypothetical protein